MKTIYMLEVGVVWEDGERFDENVIFFNTYEEAQEYGLDYVKKGVERTYYMIWTYDMEDDCYVHECGLIYSGNREVDWGAPYWEDFKDSKIKINGEIQDLYKVGYCVGAFSHDCNNYYRDYEYEMAFGDYKDTIELYGEDEAFIQKEYWNEYTQDLDYFTYVC